MPTHGLPYAREKEREGFPLFLPSLLFSLFWAKDRVDWLCAFPGVLRVSASRWSFFFFSSATNAWLFCRAEEDFAVSCLMFINVLPSTHEMKSFIKCAKICFWNNSAPSYLFVGLGWWSGVPTVVTLRQRIDDFTFDVFFPWGRVSEDS